LAIKQYKSNKRYKCPYCEERYFRGDLIEHVEKEHEALIPEGYDATRVVYDSINKTDHGKCMICGKPVYEWDSKHYKYKNLCDNPKCREEVRRIALERHMRVYNKPTLLDDPEQQEKMLARRRISGSYKFTDGGLVNYTGKYERNALEFIDKVMGYKSSEIECPGPVLTYEFQGKEHNYIPDIYIIPANLLIEVKDGGNNPNNRNMPEYRAKQLAKEEMVTKLGTMNYLRLTNNQFDQLLAILADIKLENLDNSDDPAKKFHINESSNVLAERYLINENDIYYNKDKFDSGEINLCFITGHSGSGKSTMGRNMGSNNIEHYELDDLQCVKDHFSMDDLKEYGDLIYSYFKGPGKKFYITYDELVEKDMHEGEYEDILFPEFVKYAMKYASLHKDKKIVLEGIWFYCVSIKGKPWFEPNEFKNYAFYIKGTSMIVSKYRAAKRDAKEKHNKIIDRFKEFNKNYFRNFKFYLFSEKQLNKFRGYFKNLMKNNINESGFINEKDIYANFSDIEKVCSSLSALDLERISRDGKYENSENVIYRYIEKIGNIPVGFIDVYWYEKVPTNAYIILAVNPKYRGRGIASKMVQNAIHSGIDKQYKFKEYVWHADKDNIESQKLAEKNGFTTNGRLDIDKRWYEYKLYVNSINEAACPSCGGGIPASCATIPRGINISTDSIQLNGEIGPFVFSYPEDDECTYFDGNGNHEVKIKNECGSFNFLVEVFVKDSSKLNTVYEYLTTNESVNIKDICYIATGKMPLSLMEMVVGYREIVFHRMVKANIESYINNGISVMNYTLDESTMKELVYPHVSIAFCKEGYYAFTDKYPFATTVRKNRNSIRMNEIKTLSELYNKYENISKV